MCPETGVFDRFDRDGLGFGFRPDLLGSVLSIIMTTYVNFAEQSSPRTRTIHSNFLQALDMNI